MVFQCRFPFTFQRYSPKDCHLSSGFLLESSNGLSVAFSNGFSCLRFLACNMLPWSCNNIIEQPAHDVHLVAVTLPYLAQDKGGPSKGGFLNNRLFSSTDLYLCNEINGMCKYTINYSGKSYIIQETTSTRTTFVLARHTHHPARAVTCRTLTVWIVGFAWRCMRAYGQPPY